MPGIQVAPGGRAESPPSSASDFRHPKRVEGSRQTASTRRNGGSEIWLLFLRFLLRTAVVVCKEILLPGSLRPRQLSGGGMEDQNLTLFASSSAYSVPPC